MKHLLAGKHVPLLPHFGGYKVVECHYTREINEGVADLESATYGTLALASRYSSYRSRNGGIQNQIRLVQPRVREVDRQSNAEGTRLVQHVNKLLTRQFVLEFRKAALRSSEALTGTSFTMTVVRLSKPDDQLCRALHIPDSPDMIRSGITLFSSGILCLSRGS